MRACPECAENIQSAAKVCRFCGHRFSAVEVLDGERAQRSEDMQGTLTKAIPVVLILLFVWFCSQQQPTATSTKPEKIVAAKEPIMIRTIAGEPETQAFLVEPRKHVSLSDLADGVRDAGYRCEAAKAFHQIEENGEVMDVYKLDCLKESYQLTLVAGNAHIKPWTGNIFGP
ncbi:zinc ribbon domain-containing protein [Sphingomonas sp. RB56-2]|uniref:Zinc ribbon domain-containing protein n=1 Tax=Sphingomonas brevis TaxID=2908206 RepID=A0ABT0S9W3_9SPHN|nr:zinc ribbon domain-containing protein [Sphingomonas brevis]MCL6741167.1 zinc ribbon domain-containing protein [Sphingomonas brevis]